MRGTAAATGAEIDEPRPRPAHAGAEIFRGGGKSKEELCLSREIGDQMLLYQRTKIQNNRIGRLRKEIGFL